MRLKKRLIKTGGVIMKLFLLDVYKDVYKRQASGCICASGYSGPAAAGKSS